MKFNLENAVQAIKRLFKRFPYTTLLIIVEFFVLCMHYEIDKWRIDQVNSMVLTAIEMGIFSLVMLTISIQLFTERFKGSLKNKIVMMASATLLVSSLTYLFNYREIQSVEILQGIFTGNSYRMLIMMFISSISLLILPFVKDMDNKEWWNFTTTFVTRGAISALYSIVTFIGLSLALFALETFWEFKFSEQQYMIVMFFSFVLVAPLHLLNGLYVFYEKDLLISLPKFLSIFTKYILTPLLAIYTVILYPYIFSFPFKNEWPANEASTIILVFLAMGYAGVGLFYGLTKKSEDWKFSRLFTKIFAALSLPTLVFWVYSLYLRIDAYGVTVNRFVMMSIILWFIGVGAYYLLAKVTNVKYVLSSFVLLLVVLFYLPFTAFFWSEKSQINRLVEMAKNEEIFKDGKIVVGEKPKNKSSNENMKEMVVYINKFHTLNTIKKSLSSEIVENMEIDKNGYSPNFLYEYSDLGNVFFTEVPALGPSTELFTLTLEDHSQIDIPKGYSHVKYVNITQYARDESKVVINYDNFEFGVYIDLGVEGIYDSESSKDIDYVNKSSRYVTSEISIMSVGDENALLILTSLDGYRDGNKITEVQNVTGYLFTK